MRFTLAHAVLLGLVAAIPLSTAHPHGVNLDRRGVTDGLITAETTDDSTLGRVAAGEAERRWLLEAIDPRGIPRLGDKPPKDKDLPGAPGGKPGGGDGKPGDGVGTPVGSGTAPKFADANLEAARNKGYTLSKSLDDAIFKNAPEPEKKDLTSLGYQKSGGSAAPIIQYPSDKGKPTYLTKYNINELEKESWKKRRTFRSDGGSSKDEPILETYANPTDGAMIIKQSWNKDRDPAPKATWTDMVNDQWMTVAKNNPKNLKYVIRDNIQDIDTTDSSGIILNTKKAIDEVFESNPRAKNKKDQTLTLDRESADAKDRADYELLAAQTHVARVIQWMKDRHASLGDKKIKTLHVNSIEGPGDQYSIIIELA
ncbi:hypothetical protein CGRA01v4_12026 [Colletotrichum graminicola]|uniref:Uncharacterized protein n=1 Tax=Colletotrichum graminicola (strain M1.001 / M2 / FGSC 10212) TaxID=645133 RepID=E3QBN3_COLGM|nr:uncharacterized protein GLRG_03516 [Colletotrichum graminicola M1.001]EFQ28372.1 hypothetical protein GLRG_03516 [Colletotrichum graminicola M1.001]WDK20739.1 hypothetical protein CGRA01v4_12026 [Colletotrichum graminicola]